MSAKVKIFIMLFSAAFIVNCKGAEATLPDEGDLIFRSLDKAILGFWLEEEATSAVLDDHLDDIRDHWSKAKLDMWQVDYPHFQLEDFITLQDNRLNLMHGLVRLGKVGNAKKEAFMMLLDFKEVRQCFTEADYDFDVVLNAYVSYRDVHEIIHDEMMGLYEWAEFVWHVDQLKCKIELMEARLCGLDGCHANQQMKDALYRVDECFTTLDASLGDAYRPDFEIPCHTLHQAFKQVLSAYKDGVSVLEPF